MYFSQSWILYFKLSVYLRLNINLKGKCLTIEKKTIGNIMKHKPSIYEIYDRSSASLSWVLSQLGLNSLLVFKFLKNPNVTVPNIHTSYHPCVGKRLQESPLLTPTLREANNKQ